MRGLTAFERTLLVTGGEVLDAKTEATLRELLQLGRMYRHEDQDWFYFDNTDLGSLALRVCPIEND
jgi:hypothetical protein